MEEEREEGKGEKGERAERREKKEEGRREEKGEGKTDRRWEVKGKEENRDVLGKANIYRNFLGRVYGFVPENRDGKGWAGECILEV